MRVELLYFEGCPGATPLADRVHALLDELGQADRVEMVEIHDATEAVAARFLGSPSLRVEGRDIEPAADRRDDYGMKCRLYATTAGLRPAPSTAWIARALDPAGRAEG